MKSKTMWYILLGMILLISSLMETLNHFLGMVLFGIVTYAAGSYHIKWKLEKELIKNEEK